MALHAIGNKLELHIDYWSLKWIFSKPSLNMCQRWWIEFLHEYNFTIKLQADKDNLVIDALIKKSIIAWIIVLQKTLLNEVKNWEAKICASQSLSPPLLSRGRSKSNNASSKIFNWLMVHSILGIVYTSQRTPSWRTKECVKHMTSKWWINQATSRRMLLFNRILLEKN